MGASIVSMIAGGLCKEVVLIRFRAKEPWRPEIALAPLESATRHEAGGGGEEGDIESETGSKQREKVEKGQRHAKRERERERERRERVCV